MRTERPVAPVRHPVGSPSRNTGGNVLFQARLSDRARWLLDRLSTDDADRILDCIDALRRNPYRDLQDRVTLVWAMERLYRDAFRCGDWAIAYEFLDDNTLSIEAIGTLFY
jgi:hypothetical protein